MFLRQLRATLDLNVLEDEARGARGCSFERFETSVPWSGFRGPRHTCIVGLRYKRLDGTAACRLSNGGHGPQEAPVLQLYADEEHARDRLAGTVDAIGEVTFVAESGETAVEETVEVLYRPPDGMFRAEDGLLYCGGFNGWEGEEEGLTMPMLRREDGSYSVSINIPNFAKVLDFAVTDGVRYDTGPDGAFYHIRVTHVREMDKEGNVILYRQDDDGGLVKTGVVEKVDPKELERMLEEEVAKQQYQQAAAGLDTPQEQPMVDENLMDVNKNLRNEVMVSKDEQQAVQQMRAEASVLGERLGLGNMQVSEARDVFDAHDNNETGMLDVDKLGIVLEGLGFDQAQVDDAERRRLLGKYVLAERPGATEVSLNEFMYIFAELDRADYGIDII